MKPAPRSILAFLALPLLALAAALVSNRLAAPSRRLAWRSALQAPAPAPPPPTGPLVPPSASAPAEPAPAKHRPILPRVPASQPVPSRPSEPVAAPDSATPIREIEGAEVWSAFQSGLPFLDARRSAEYAEGHIPGAFCVPVWEADVADRILHFEAARRPVFDDPIVIYCAGGGCRDSHLLARKLMDLGYHHLLIDRDGFPGWVAAGRPVEKGQP